VQKLISYTENPENSFALEAELQVAKANIHAELILEFSLKDPQALFEVPKMPGSWAANQVARQDGLWAATCFEAFLQPWGSNQYYEFNFALLPAWNAYLFNAYRQPQPPKATEDFILKTMNWEPAQKSLRVVLENHSGAQKFNVGLTAILLEKSGAKHYLAVAHKGDKPDFHLNESFILQRGQ